ncbi:helicase MOV-10 isoform X2 [Carettochelys insculpta]|uniref:helicase MOV-10 isoform X2 n=1 Tax=Carettochelys insculpta TaxID=44489 RepID=UPI003EB82C5C
MPRFTFAERRAAGERFVQFLLDTGREQERGRAALRLVYNQEFRHRNDTREPNFSSVLFTLRQSGRAEVRGDFVLFHKVKKRVRLPNQYWTPEPEQPPAGGQEPSADPSPRRGHAKRRAEFIGGKHGVEIFSEHDQGNGRIRVPVTPGEPATASLRVQNNGQGTVTLLSYRALRKQREITFHDASKVTSQQPLMLQPGASYMVEARCLTQCYGYFPVTLRFEFTKEQDGPFSIGRFVAAVASSRLAQELGPSAPYRPYQAKLKKPVMHTVEDGFPPDSTRHPELEQLISLGAYKYPANLKDMVSSERRSLRLSLAAELQFENYRQKFQLLLHLEELQMEVDIRRYDMEDAKMVKDPKNKKLLVLEVPGVAENRPSVLRGDHLFVTQSDQRSQPQLVRYKGYVHALELEKVKLGFSSKLVDAFVDKLKFDVTFTFNRLPLRVQHRAVELAEKQCLRDVLFPSFSCGKSLLPEGSRLRLFDRSLETNQEQYRAVWQIVTGLSRPAPYLIFGPPGTGKTVTVVEAIKQVAHCIQGSHVLACAPSNSASDLLCQRLLKHLDKGSVYRINANSRDYRQVPEEIKAGQCKLPRRPLLPRLRRRVRPRSGAGERGGYCGDSDRHGPGDQCQRGAAGVGGRPQAAGPDPEVPTGRRTRVRGLAAGKAHAAQLVVPKGSPGLQPSVHHQVTAELQVPCCPPGDPQPAVLRRGAAGVRRPPHQLFLLRVGGAASAGEGAGSQQASGHRPAAALSLVLSLQGFPVIFHGVSGEDQREGNSPSFFNVQEIDVLVTYLKKLLQSQGKRGRSRVSPKEIGIISPYRKQVEKIRLAITQKDPELKQLPDIKKLKVGSVEEFQGQERRVLLVSTVRSGAEYLSVDEKFKLGFLKNPKRFNVAITRAKALLIIVGNPAVLSKDPHWGTFLKYCREKGGYTGCPYPQASAEEDDLAEELGSLHLSMQAAGTQMGESHVQQHLEPEWRHEH